MENCENQGKGAFVFMRKRGQGQRFDYLFRKMHKITDELDLNFCNKKAFLKLCSLYNEVLNKDTYSDYEKRDKENLLNTISWYRNESYKALLGK